MSRARAIFFDAGVQVARYEGSDQLNYCKKRINL